MCKKCNNTGFIVVGHEGLTEIVEYCPAPCPHGWAAWEGISVPLIKKHMLQRK